MYQNMYNSFSSLDFGETSHGDISNNEIPDFAFDDWLESEEPGSAGLDPVYPTNQVSSLDENTYTTNEETSNPSKIKGVFFKWKIPNQN